jgi:hypothetical protein
MAAVSPFRCLVGVLDEEGIRQFSLAAKAAAANCCFPARAILGPLNCNQI